MAILEANVVNNGTGELAELTFVGVNLRVGVGGGRTVDSVELAVVDAFLELGTVWDVDLSLFVATVGLAVVVAGGKESVRIEAERHEARL